MIAEEDDDVVVFVRDRLHFVLGDEGESVEARRRSRSSVLSGSGRSSTGSAGRCCPGRQCSTSCARNGRTEQSAGRTTEPAITRVTSCDGWFDQCDAEGTG